MVEDAVMDVGSSTSGLYAQYKSLVDGLRGRASAVMPQVEVDAASEQITKSRGHTTFSNISGSGGGGSTGSALSALLDQSTQIQAQESGSTKEFLNEYLNPKYKTEARDAVNAAAHDFLEDYATKHLNAWNAAGTSLGINMIGWGSDDNFSAYPPGANLDFGTGIPNSQAERIFRKTASPEEVSQFDRVMAPHIQAAQDRIKEGLNELFGTTISGMNEFAPAAEKFEAAGVTYQDLRNTIVTRGADGNFIVQRGSWSTKADEIEQVINGNPEVKAIYENRLANGHPELTTTTTVEQASDPNSIHAKYQDLVDRMNNGEITAMQAVAEHRDLFKTAAGYIVRLHG